MPAMLRGWSRAAARARRGRLGGEGDLCSVVVTAKPCSPRSALRASGSCQRRGRPGRSVERGRDRFATRAARFGDRALGDPGADREPPAGGRDPGDLGGGLPRRRGRRSPRIRRPARRRRRRRAGSRRPRPRRTRSRGPRGRRAARRPRAAAAPDRRPSPAPRAGRDQRRVAGAAAEVDERLALGWSGGVDDGRGGGSSCAATCS